MRPPRPASGSPAPSPLPWNAWDAIAKRETLVRWFCPGTRTCRLDEWEFREGGTFRLTFVPTQDDGFDGPSPAHGVLRRIAPNQEVVMAWNWDFPDPDNNEPESRVILRLREVPEGTEIALIHDGLPGRESVQGHYGGWQTVLPKLDRLFPEKTE